MGSLPILRVPMTAYTPFQPSELGARLVLENFEWCAPQSAAGVSQSQAQPSVDFFSLEANEENMKWARTGYTSR